MAATATAAVRLKKILEWELSLDARDLRSHAWYHGSISRAAAEQIVGEQDGDFLVRDCTSQPGNYVLSCRSRGQNLHFVINKMVLQANTVYESVQYRFEDDGFDTVPDLITYYVGSGKPITVASAAKIQKPRNRRHPLSFYNAAAAASSSSSETRSSQQSTPAPAATSGAALSESPTTRRRDSFAGTGTCTGAGAGAGAVSASASASAKQRSISLRPGDVDALVVAATAAAAASAVGSVDFVVKTQPIVSYRRDSDSDSNSNSNSKSNSSVDRYSFGTRTWLPRSRSCRTGTETGSQPRRSSSIAPPPNVETVVFGPDSGFDQGPYANVRVDDHRCSPPSRIRKDYAVNDCDDRNCNGSVAVAVADADDEAAPPKPSRRFIAVPQHSMAAATHCATSSSVSGNGSDDSAQSCNAVVDAAAAASADVRKATSGVVIKNPKYEYYDVDDEADGCSRRDDRDVSLGGSPASDKNDISCGVIAAAAAAAAVAAQSVSVFDLDNFHTLLLPTMENKPLDTCALQGVHMLLMDSGSRILANHLTRADLELTVRDFSDERRQTSDSDFVSNCDCDAGAACKTGIELCCLPQGRRHRYDLIERSECLRLLVAVTILTCATESERAQLLNKWIQVAVDTKTALGNLYGFCGIMLGLCTPQVLRLNETWHILRQRYTDSAFNFEAKLRPTLKCMNESTNPLAPNTTIPHLLPVILLYETNYPRNLGRTGCGGGGGGVHVQQGQAERKRERDRDRDEDEMCQILTTDSHVWNVSINQWEACSPDLGLGTLYSHLNASRQFNNLLPTFRRNAEIVLTDSKIDQLLRDMFRTEFHMKFLWGSRGAKVNASERYTKFQQVLNVMSQKCETIDNDDDDDDDAAFVFTRSGDWYGGYVTDGVATVTTAAAAAAAAAAALSD